MQKESVFYILFVIFAANKLKTLILTPMQKKLKLALMALCLAPSAYAQTDKPQQPDGQDAITSEQSFTFTEAQLGEDDDMSQNVTIVSSNQNIYASQVGYLFSPVRFRYRAFNQKYNEIYINGAPMNDMESGQFRYSLVGGLNQQTRGVENALPFEFNNFSMSGMGGSNNYDFRPSHMPTGQRLTLSGANRNYTVRTMYTYNSGLRPDGWAFSGNVTYRWANMATSYVEGTFYNSLSYFFGAEKKLNELARCQRLCPHPAADLGLGHQREVEADHHADRPLLDVQKHQAELQRWREPRSRLLEEPAVELLRRMEYRRLLGTHSDGI